MSEDQTQNMPSQPVTLESLAAQRTQMMTEFQEFRAFIEPKLYDTRPIWEQALKEILELRQEMNERLSKVEKELRQLTHRFDNQVPDFSNTRGDVRDLQQRVDDLERPKS